MNDLNDLTYFKNLSDVQNEQIRQFIIQHEKTQSALLEEKQRVRDLVKCLIETTIIDDVNWQKKNKDCLDLALHGIANNLYRTIKKFGDV